MCARSAAGGTERGDVLRPPAVRFDAVSFSYEGARSADPVLDRISFSVQDGEFVAVMGPSGCGKSTVLNLLAGFESASSGQVTCHGKPVDKPAAERGVVFQRPTLYPWMSVRENVMFGPKALGLRAEARQRAEALLTEVGLDGFGDHKPYELSGGMQHRVEIARTLATRPQALLMDEPFAALDAQTRADMQTMLLDVWQRHRNTVVFVTHDIEEGLLLADRVIVMSRRPSTVLAEIPVPFPRPREYEIVLDPEFVQLRGHVRSLIIARNPTNSSATLPH